MQEIKIPVKAPSVIHCRLWGTAGLNRGESSCLSSGSVPAEVAHPDSSVYFSQSGLVMSPRTHRCEQSPHAQATTARTLKSFKLNMKGQPAFGAGPKITLLASERALKASPAHMSENLQK